MTEILSVTSHEIENDSRFQFHFQLAYHPFPLFIIFSFAVLSRHNTIVYNIIINWLVPVNTVQLNDIRMIAQRTQKHYFAKRSLCIGLVSECVKDFFHGNRLLGPLVGSLPNNTIGTFAESL